jgi:hypothetical protein
MSTAVAAGAAIAGTVVSVAGARAQARGQAAAARFNAAVQERNAKASDIDAEWSRIVSGLEIQDFLDDAESFNAQVSSANRKNGWTNTGTALDVYMESIAEQEKEVSRLQTQAIAKQTQFREQGINMRMGAELQRINARNYITAGRWKAASAVTSGVSQTAFLLR